MSWVWLLLVLWNTTAQHKVHELVNHDSSVLLFPSLRSFCSCITKSHQVHQCLFWIIVYAGPRGEKCRKQLSLTWLYIPSVYDIEYSLIRMFKMKPSFCLSCLSSYSRVYPSIYGFNVLSVYVWLSIHLAWHTVTHTFVSWFIAMHMKEHIHVTTRRFADAGKDETKIVFRWVCLQFEAYKCERDTENNSFWILVCGWNSWT